MRKKSNSKHKKQNKNLLEVAELTGKSYGYVRQVATGVRCNTLIERAIIAFEEHDFLTLQEIKEQVSQNTPEVK